MSVVLYVILTIFAFLCIYPFYYIIIYSISDANQAASAFSGLHILLT